MIVLVFAPVRSKEPKQPFFQTRPEIDRADRGFLNNQFLKTRSNTLLTYLFFEKKTGIPVVVLWVKVVSHFVKGNNAFGLQFWREFGESRNGR